MYCAGMSAPTRPRHVTFLLAQVGSEVSRHFAERLHPLGLAPSDALCLRIIALAGPLNQRQLAERMGLVPSRVVTLIDALEGRGLVQRRTSTHDRRHRELSLTDDGLTVFGRLRAVAVEHEREFTADLTDDDVATLLRLLGTVAAARGLASEAQPDLSPVV